MIGQDFDNFFDRFLIGFEEETEASARGRSVCLWQREDSLRICKSRIYI